MAKEDKFRLDVFIYQTGLAESREKAQALIIAGKVSVNRLVCLKPSRAVSQQDEIELLGQNKFVSRGGLKLDKAMSVFPIASIVEDGICADVGASTGGFTDCLLQNGAKKVYAIDVGYGQLDWKLRSDQRVIVMERKNARMIEPNWFDSEIDFACMDVSFISIALILRPLFSCLRQGGEAVALIKPQFEAGRDKVGKKGVVRDKDVHVEVICRCLGFSRDFGYSILGLDYSPITGPQGNIEFLMRLGVASESAWDRENDRFYAEKVVDAASSLHSND